MKLFFANVIGFCFANPIVPAIILCLFLIAGGFGFIRSCRSANTEKKIGEIKANVSELNGEVKVLANEKTNVQKDVNILAGNSNQTVGNLINIENKPVNSFGNSWDESRRAYCAKYPGDCH